MISRNNHITFLSLNCNGLAKLRRPSARASLIRFLRQQSAHIITLQETHASTPTLRDTFHKQFCAHQSFWTQHCGIVLLSSALHMHEISLDFTTRAQLVHIQHTDNAFHDFYVLNVYAPAHSKRERYQFFNSLYQHIAPLVNNQIHTDRLFIMGDFNYDLQRSGLHLNAPSTWLTWLDLHFFNCTRDELHFDGIPTYRHSNYLSTIDYIYAPSQFSSSIHHKDISFVNNEWTDHALLSATFTMGPPKLGKGLWRGNPLLFQQPSFRRQLNDALTSHYPRLHDMPSPQSQWESIKGIITHHLKTHSRQQADWRKKQLSALQSKRNRFLRSKPPAAIRAWRLPIMERQIATLQQEMVDVQALRAGQRWRERGETSAGYLKRTIQDRQVKRSIATLQHPHTGAMCSTTSDMHSAVQCFYQELYSPEPISTSAMDTMLTQLPSTLRLEDSDQEDLVRAFSLDDLQSAASRTPHHSSPGPDGLPYQAWRLVFTHPLYTNLVMRVYDDALQHGIFPSSWNDTCMCLLPKKGDLTNLANWRPISLINCDAKIFTRLLNARIINAASSLITPYQCGFMPGRFIGVNGLMTRIAMEQASQQGSTELGLLLDQEKAYDRVHPDYLRAVLLRFGFPASIIHIICALFFSTSIHINVNGHISTPIQQLRGLRQGDPLSPILFNLALEPFLRSIIGDANFQGFQPWQSATSSPLPPIKLLAYADDVMVFLKDPMDFERLLSHVACYQRASNARFNRQKTQAISLSGATHTTWNQVLMSNNMPAPHDRLSPSAITYLGYPLASSTHQLQLFLDQLLHDLSTACKQHSQRTLSIRGRATVANSLVLSRVWHVLRLTPTTTVYLNRLKSIIGKFLMRNMFPRIAFTTLCRLRSYGGIAILDPATQQNALQLRWIQELLSFSTDEWLPHTHVLYHHLLRDRRFSDGDIHTLLRCQEARKPSTREVSISTLIFRAMDKINIDWDIIQPSPATSLLLPLNAIWSTADDATSFRQPGFKNLLVGDLFVLDGTTSLRLQTRADGCQYPLLLSRFRTHLDQDRLKLHSYFARLCDHTQATHVHTSRLPDTSILTSSFVEAMDGNMWRSKTYRKLIAPANPSDNSSVSWTTFWRTPMNHTARNVWYRLLHDRLPTSSRVHHIAPTFVTSHLCRICLTTCDDDFHFLMGCPKKGEVWQQVWRPIHCADPDLSSLFQCLRTAQFPGSTQQQRQQATLCSCILQAIWCAHWAFIFNNTNFISTAVAAHASHLYSSLSV